MNQHWFICHPVSSHVHKYTQVSSAWGIHTYEKPVYRHAHLLSHSSRALSKSHLARETREEKKRHQSCLYNETERAAPCRITDCTEESIPSPENRGEEEKGRGKKENPPRTMQHNKSGNDSEANSEADWRNERQREATERLFILGRTLVATKSGIKTGPIVVRLWSVSPHGKQREEERDGCSSHEVSVILPSEETRLSREGKLLRLTDGLFTLSVDILLSLSLLCPPCTTHPNGVVMTSSGVNWEAGRGLIQSKVLYATVGAGGSDRCQCCNYQPSCLLSNTPPCTPPPPPHPCPIPFSFINSNPPHLHPATIFVWLCLFPPPCSQQKQQQRCLSVLGMETWWQSVNQGRQLSFIVCL